MFVKFIRIYARISRYRLAGSDVIHILNCEKTAKLSSKTESTLWFTIKELSDYIPCQH